MSCPNFESFAEEIKEPISWPHILGVQASVRKQLSETSSLLSVLALRTREYPYEYSNLSGESVWPFLFDLTYNTAPFGISTSLNLSDAGHPTASLSVPTTENSNLSLNTNFRDIRASFSLNDRFYTVSSTLMAYNAFKDALASISMTYGKPRAEGAGISFSISTAGRLSYCLLAQTCIKGVNAGVVIGEGTLTTSFAKYIEDKTCVHTSILLEPSTLNTTYKLSFLRGFEMSKLMVSFSSAGNLMSLYQRTITETCSMSFSGFTSFKDKCLSVGVGFSLLE